jgi:hypothetical protein
MDKLKLLLAITAMGWLGFMFSCQAPNSKDAYVVVLDSLEKQTDRTDSIFRTIPFEKAEEVAQTIVNKIDTINALNKGKHPEDMLSLISTYSLIRWFELTSGEEEEREKNGLKNVKEAEQEPVEMLEKQIEYSRNQLENLRHDYLNKNLSADDASKYLGDERRAVKALYEYTFSKALLYKNHLAAFDSLDPLIDARIEKLSRK